MKNVPGQSSTPSSSSASLSRSGFGTQLPSSPHSAFTKATLPHTRTPRNGNAKDDAALDSVVEQDSDSSSQASLECRPLQPLSSTTSSQASDYEDAAGTDEAGPIHDRISASATDEGSIPLLLRVQRIRENGSHPGVMATLSWTRTVPRDQQRILASNDAWFPTLPGKPVRCGTVPVHILKQWQLNADKPTQTQVLGDSSVVSWSPSPSPQDRRNLTVAQTHSEHLSPRSDIIVKEMCIRSPEKHSQVHNSRPGQPEREQLQSSAEEFLQSSLSPADSGAKLTGKNTRMTMTSSGKSDDTAPKILVLDTPLPHAASRPSTATLDHTQTSCVAATAHPAANLHGDLMISSSASRATLEAWDGPSVGSQNQGEGRDESYMRTRSDSSLKGLRSGMRTSSNGTSVPRSNKRHASPDSNSPQIDLLFPSQASSLDGSMARNRRLNERLLLERRKFYRSISTAYTNHGPEGESDFLKFNMPRVEAVRNERLSRLKSDLFISHQLPQQVHSDDRRLTSGSSLPEEPIEARPELTSTARKRALPWPHTEVVRAKGFEYEGLHDIRSSANLLPSSPPHAMSLKLTGVSPTSERGLPDTTPLEASSRPSRINHRLPQIGTSDKATNAALPRSITSDNNVQPTRSQRRIGPVQAFVEEYVKMQASGGKTSESKTYSNFRVDPFDW